MACTDSLLYSYCYDEDGILPPTRPISINPKLVNGVPLDYSFLYFMLVNRDHQKASTVFTVIYGMIFSNFYTEFLGPLVTDFRTPDNCRVLLPPWDAPLWSKDWPERYLIFRIGKFTVYFEKRSVSWVPLATVNDLK